MAEGRVLSLDEFAAVTAQLEGGAPKDRVLAEAGLSAEAWLAAQAMWLERMAKLAAKGRPKLHERFLERVEVYRNEAKAQEQATPALEGPMPRPPQAVVAAIARARPARRSPALAASPGLPFARSAAPVAPPKQAGTAMFSVVPSPPLPFASGDTEAAPASRTLDDEPSSSDERAPSSGALPFRKTGAAREPSRPPGLPFKASNASPKAPDGALPFSSPPPVPPRPPSPPPTAKKSATMALAAFPAAEALPFATKGGRSESSATERSVLPFAPAATEVARGEQKGGLPFGSSPEARALATQRKPFDASAVHETLGVADDAPAGPAPKMTVEQYAWLCAMIARAPERTEATLAWMQLTSEQKDELDRQFEELFRRDSDARRRFFAAMANHDD